VKMEVDETGSGSYPVADFGRSIKGVKPSGLATRKGNYLVICFLRQYYLHI
jgi:hypothetical protein